MRVAQGPPAGNPGQALLEKWEPQGAAVCQEVDLLPTRPVALTRAGRLRAVVERGPQRQAGRSVSAGTVH